MPGRQRLWHAAQSGYASLAPENLRAARGGRGRTRSEARPGRPGHGAACRPRARAFESPAIGPTSAARPACSATASSGLAQRFPAAPAGTSRLAPSAGAATPKSVSADPAAASAWLAKRPGGHAGSGATASGPSAASRSFSCAAAASASAPDPAATDPAATGSSATSAAAPSATAPSTAASGAAATTSGLMASIAASPAGPTAARSAIARRVATHRRRAAARRAIAIRHRVAGCRSCCATGTEAPTAPAAGRRRIPRCRIPRCRLRGRLRRCAIPSRISGLCAGPLGDA